MNLLVRYITQGRVEGGPPADVTAPAGQPVLTLPEHRTDTQRKHRHGLTVACPDMITLTSLVGLFAALLQPSEGNSARLDAWITAVRAADLSRRTFARGLELDRDAVQAAVTLPHHNGGTEGVNTKTKRIMRQIHCRAGFTMRRHRILLN